MILNIVLVLIFTLFLFEALILSFYDPKWFWMPFWGISSLLVYFCLLWVFSARDFYVFLSILFHFLLLIPFLLIKRKDFTISDLLRGWDRKKFGYAVSYPIIIFVMNLFNPGIISYGLDFYKFISIHLVEPSLLYVLLVILIAPVTEEIFLRYCVQREIVERFGETLGLISSSLFNVIIHIPKMAFVEEYVLPSSKLISKLFYSYFLFFAPLNFFVTGMILGVIYQKMGRVRYPILSHILYNATTGLFGLR